MRENVVPIEIAQWRAKGALMQQLVQAPGWDAYQNDVRVLCEEAVQEWLRDGDKSEFARGYVAGLQMAAGQAQRVIDHVAKLPPHKDGTLIA